MRAAPGSSGGTGSAAGAGGRRKTDLASFQRASTKEDDAGCCREVWGGDTEVMMRSVAGMDGASFGS
nr:unnamed protein product [Digitaria exilis]